MASVELDLASDLDSIPKLADAVDAFAEANDLPGKIQFQLNLVLEELVTNIVSHAEFGTKTGRILVAILLEHGRLEVRVIDNGSPFDPVTEAPAPDIDGPLEERSIGGLGIHLVKSFMEEVHYTRRDDRNETLLIKHVAPS